MTLDDILAAIAHRLDAAGAATWTAAGAYTLPASPPPIFLDVMPTAPDEVAVLSAGTIPGQTALDTDRIVQLQIRTRGPVGDTTGVHITAGTIRGVIHDATVQVWGPIGAQIYVPLAVHTSTAMLGMDANRRLLRSDNYLIHTQEV